MADLSKVLCEFVEKSDYTSWAQRYCHRIIRRWGCYTVENIQNVQVLDIIGP